MVLDKPTREKIAKEKDLFVHEVCCYCGTADKDVEAGGIWYCPNDRCQGPSGGAARHLHECKECVTRITMNSVILVTPCEVYNSKHALEEKLPPADPTVNIGDKPMCYHNHNKTAFCGSCSWEQDCKAETR